MGGKMHSFATLRPTLNDKNIDNDYWQGRLLCAHEIAAHSREAGAVMKHFHAATRRP
jgi:hypothetical protein